MSWKNLIPIIGLSFSLLLGANAQDFHYSQINNNPLHLNPALTGVFFGDLRIQGNYRNQWANVPVDYRTFSVVADKKFRRSADQIGWWSAGLGLNYDRSGFSNLTWMDINAQGSYTRYMGKGFFASLGGNLAYVNRSFDTQDLRFEWGYDEGLGQYIPGSSSGEVFANTNNGFLDLSLGLNFRLQALADNALFDFKEKRSRVDFGIGFWHINRADQSFIEDEKVRLNIRYSPYAQGLIQLSSIIDLALGFSAQFQGPYSEKVGMIGGRVHLDTDPKRQIAVQLSFGYRFEQFGDAWYPMLQVDYRDLRVGLSWDVNISRFQVATDRNGGPELSARYIFKKPLPPKGVCPPII